MRLLPDTQLFTPCLVSVASFWEVAIKHRLGNLAVTQAAFRDQSLGQVAPAPSLSSAVITYGKATLCRCRFSFDSLI